MFKLLRYFSIASAGGIILIIALLMVFFRHLSVEDLLKVGERQNEILALSIGNHVWEGYGPYLSTVKGADDKTALIKEKTQEIAHDLSIQIKGLPILRVDILNLKGLILFSTATDQIAQNKSADSGYISAQKGNVTSRIIHLKDDDPFAQSSGSTDMLSSYLPFYDNEGKVVGAFQIFSDTTLLLADIDSHVLHVFLVLVAALALLYVILYQVVRRADQTIKKQHFELQSNQNELRESEKRIRDIVDSAADAIVTIDTSNTIKSFNASAEEIFGIQAIKAIGHNVGVLISCGHYEGFVDRLRASGDAQDTRDFSKTIELPGRKQDGTEVLLEVSLSYSSSEGEVLFAAIMRDITERKKLDQLKSDFIATVSHELRTPLTSIKGALGLLADGTLGALPEKTKALADIASRNTNRLVELVNDILDTEKINSGMMEFQYETLNLSELVKESVAINEGYAREHGVTFDLSEFPPEVMVRGDGYRLSQVVSNLLSNAAKYSPNQGTVRITIRYHGDEARVSVSDDGPGIPVEFREHIFEKFAQVDASDSRLKGGTGLGLNIAKSIVEMHDGTIHVAAKEGGGATFFFDLPRVS